jgi:hypothetical protein
VCGQATATDSENTVDETALPLAIAIAFVCVENKQKTINQTKELLLEEHERKSRVIRTRGFVTCTEGRGEEEKGCGQPDNICRSTAMQ